MNLQKRMMDWELVRSILGICVCVIILGACVVLEIRHLTGIHCGLIFRKEYTPASFSFDGKHTHYCAERYLIYIRRDGQENWIDVPALEFDRLRVGDQYGDRLDPERG